MQPPQSPVLSVLSRPDSSALTNTELFLLPKAEPRALLLFGIGSSCEVNAAGRIERCTIVDVVEVGKPTSRVNGLIVSKTIFSFT